MGTNIRDILLNVRESINMRELANKKIAIDAYNALYQFLSVIRQPDGTPLMNSEGRVTSHLTGLFYRTINLLENKLNVIYVFDGVPPEMKHLTLKERIKRREEAERKWKEMLEKGEEEEARKYAQASSKLTQEMVNEAKQLLQLMGVGWVQAPSEGEAQASFMAKKGEVYGVGSQDYDSLIFGSPLLIRNLSITGRRRIAGTNQYKEITPERIRLSEVLRTLDINQEQLICLAILVGTDYNEGGIKGIGAKKALEIVKKYKTRDAIERFVRDKWTFDVSFEDIYEFFNKPEVNENYKIEQGKFDEQRLLEMLVEVYEFSEDRVKNAIERLKKMREGGKQTTLF